jgi:hypothetical protein
MVFSGRFQTVQKNGSLIRVMLWTVWAKSSLIIFFLRRSWRDGQNHHPHRATKAIQTPSPKLAITVVHHHWATKKSQTENPHPTTIANEPQKATVLSASNHGTHNRSSWLEAFSNTLLLVKSSNQNPNQKHKSNTPRSSTVQKR